MKFLITGVAGYIGSQLAKFLVENEYEVYGLDVNPIPKKLANYVEKDAYLQIDLSLEKNIDYLNSFINNIGLDFTIIHLAALKSVEDAEINPELYWHNNLGCTQNLLKIMQFNNLNRLIFASSAAVYEPIHEICFEDDKCGPISMYGKIKYLEEKLIESYCKSNNLNYAILRFFNVAGAIDPDFREESGNNLIPKILDAYKNNSKFQIFGVDYATRDGTCIRDYIHMEDLITAIYLTSKKIQSQNIGILNLGTSHGVSVLEMISEFSKYIEINTESKNRRNGDAPVLLASNAKAKEILGWGPKHDLTSIVKSVL